MGKSWIVICILFVPALAFSATIHVPKDYPLIQQAIDAALDGDTRIYSFRIT